MTPPIPPPPQDPEEQAAARRRTFSCGCIGCLGLFFFAGILLVLVANLPNPVILGIATIAAIIPVPTFVFLILQIDRYEREPWQVLLAAFLWGALVATFIAAISNDIITAIVSAAVGPDFGKLIGTSAVAPIVEETAKGFALLLLFWLIRNEFDNTLDGIVYGSLVGIGFAMTENILYFGRQLQSEGLIGLGLLFYIRVGLGGLGHALYTGTTGAGLGYAREAKRRWIIPIIIPGAYILGILQHATWNFVLSAVLPLVVPDDTSELAVYFGVLPIVTTILTLPGLASILIIAWLAWRREANVIREHLADEVALGTITQQEYELLPSQRSRFRAELAALKSRGTKAFFAQRDLHQAATELAFRKWHESRGEKAPKKQRRTPEDRYRQLISVIRTRLA